MLENGLIVYRCSQNNYYIDTENLTASFRLNKWSNYGTIIREIDRKIEELSQEVDLGKFVKIEVTASAFEMIFENFVLWEMRYDFDIKHYVIAGECWFYDNNETIRALRFKKRTSCELSLGSIINGLRVLDRCNLKLGDFKNDYIENYKYTVNFENYVFEYDFERKTFSLEKKFEQVVLPEWTEARSNTVKFANKLNEVVRSSGNYIADSLRKNKVTAKEIETGKKVFKYVVTYRSKPFYCEETGNNIYLETGCYKWVEE